MLRLAIIFLAFLGAVPASAATMLYRCDMDRPNDLSLLPPELLVVYDEATGQARVMDGFIISISEDPIPAQVTGDSGGQVSLRWAYRSADIAGSRTRVTYRATLRKSDGAISVSFRGHQIYGGGGHGRCEMERR